MQSKGWGREVDKKDPSPHDAERNVTARRGAVGCGRSRHVRAEKGQMGAAGSDRVADHDDGQAAAWDNL